MIKKSSDAKAWTAGKRDLDMVNFKPMPTDESQHVRQQVI